MRNAGAAAAAQAPVRLRYRCADALNHALGSRGLRRLGEGPAVSGAQPDRLRFRDHAHGCLIHTGAREIRQRAPLQQGGALEQCLVIARDARLEPPVARLRGGFPRHLYTLCCISSTTIVCGRWRGSSSAGVQRRNDVEQS